MHSTVWLKPTYRTRPEQAVGLLIFLTLSLLVYSLSFSLLPYHFLIAGSIWMVWRRFSIFTLKLEVTLFLTQLGFEILSLTTQPLLSLFALLFLLCNTILCILLYRKKEKLAQFLLIPAFLWMFAITAWKMVFT
ncbi:MAG TPA: tryptophan-rich sensory protein [Chlamydiales bacterium]|nr:tryptophan-rich sensory protein [Chlamydiales bacterium]